MKPRFLANLHIIAFVLASAHHATADDAAYTIGSGGSGVQTLTLNDSGSITATDFEFTHQLRDDSVGPEAPRSFQWGTTLSTVTVSPGVPDNAVTDTVKISIPKAEDGGSGRLFGRLQVTKP